MKLFTISHWVSFLCSPVAPKSVSQTRHVSTQRRRHFLLRGSYIIFVSMNHIFFLMYSLYSQNMNNVILRTDVLIIIWRGRSWLSGLATVTSLHSSHVSCRTAAGLLRTVLSNERKWKVCIYVYVTKKTADR